MAVRRAAVLLVAGLGLSLAACGDAGPAVTAPDRPGFDGGWTVGSGNRTDGAGTMTTSTDSTEARGGWWIGSGN